LTIEEADWILLIPILNILGGFELDKSCLNIQFSIFVDFKHTAIHTKAQKIISTLPRSQIIVYQSIPACPHSSLGKAHIFVVF
jgi:hypothetical protein